MRIVAGSQRGRRIVAPKGHSTRPTAGRTREALFNVLEHAAWAPVLSGARIIDLFAGSGALGLEALSRGAAFCLFVDNDPASLTAVNENLAALKLDDRGDAYLKDGRRLGAPPSLRRFDLALLDPPYDSGLAEPALAGLRTGGWLPSGALVVVERGRDEAGPIAPGYALLDSRTWGAARVWFLRMD
jgi:16S rRNA (guanine966-N2)-methyltransferase